MSFRAVGLYAAVLSAVVMIGCAELEKSENPLSPTVAGPIPGVSISMPLPLSPKDGQPIAVANQPVTLMLQNAETSGVRPISYTFEVATDLAFVNKVFAREGVQPGDGGRTSLRLPEALGTGRTYYWRAQALDGANSGPFSGPAHFSIFTPIVIQHPIPRSPVNGAVLSSLVPEFVFTNAARSGPVGAITYVIEVADTVAFSSLRAQWVTPEQPGETRFSAPSGLPQNAMYYWRVRAYDGNVSGPWSNIDGFRTPVIQAPAPAPGGGGGASCTSTQPLDILICRRNQYGSHMSHSELVEFLKNSARDINRAGTAGGPWGVLVKTSGAQCNGYSCDILCLGNGGSQVQRDVLIDAEGSQLPIWGNPISGGSMVVRPCEPQP
jgi:hypothetical protein